MMKDAVLIYADLGPRPVRREVLASQIRQNHALKIKGMKTSGSGEIEIIDQAASARKESLSID